jgi:7-carboxy-7-deazaguanine synthase
MNRLPVSEVFTSIQGEGVSSGLPSIFLRLGGCNLECGGKGTIKDKQLHDGATWRCDSIEVWTKSISKNIEDIFSNDDIFNFNNGYRLVITGGEPLIHQEGIKALVNHLNAICHSRPFIEVETNGTIMPDVALNYVDQWNVSPKLKNSGMPADLRINKNVLARLSIYYSQFKFVISSEEDLLEVINDFSFLSKTKIVLMPAGENQEQLSITRPIVAEICKKYSLRMTDRLHITIWNQKTGV